MAGNMLPPIIAAVRMDITQALAKLDEYSAAVGATVATTSAKFDASKAQMNAWNAGTADATDAVKTGLLAIGVGAAAAAVAVTKMGADYESATERLVTSAGESATAVRDSSGRIVGGIDYVRQGMLDMAGQVGDSAMQLDQAMYVIESGGQHGAAGLTVLKAAAEGAKTENADLTTVADATTSALQDYHLQASQSADTVSKLVAAVGAGKSTFQDLAGSLHSVLPEASAAHVSLTDILADEASMTVHGMSADQASQDLAHTIGHLQTTTAGQNKELALLGMNSMQLNDDLGSRGLSGTLLEISNRIQQNMGPDGKVVLQLQQALAGLPPSVRQMGAAVIDGSISLKDFTSSAKGLNVEQAGLVHSFATLLTSTHGIGSAQKSGQTVMQDYSQALKAATGDSTTLTTALMLTGENSSYVQGAIKSVSGATVEAGGHVKGWAEIQSTFNQKLDETKSGAEAAATGFGERLLPEATQALGYLDSQLPTIEAAGNDLVNVALAVGRFVQWISPAIPLIATAVGLFIAWRTAMTIGAAIEGVVVMVQAFAATLAILSAAEGEATVAQWLLNVAMDANPIGLVVLGIAALIAIVVLLVTHWSTVVSWLQTGWNWIKQVGEAVLNFANQHRLLAAAILLVVGGPMTLMIAGVILLATHFNQVKAAIGAFFSWLGTEAHGLVAGAWNGIVSIFQAGVAGAAAIVSGFVNGVVHLFSWLYDHNYYFKFLVDSIKLTFEKARDDAVAIWTDITSWLGARWQWVSDTATAIWTTITSFFGQKASEAGSLIQSAWNAISGWLDDRWNQIANAAGYAWGWVSNVIGSKLNEAWGHVTDFVGQITDKLGGLAGQAYQWASNMIGQFVQGIKDKIGQVSDAVGGVAGTVAGVLGFHSPPPYGPAADSDHWMPNFIDMLVGGLHAGAPRIASASAMLVGGLARPGGGTAGIGAGITPASSGASTSLVQPFTGGPSLDDTNELLVAIHDELDQIRVALTQRQRFSKAAYRPA